MDMKHGLRQEELTLRKMSAAPGSPYTDHNRPSFRYPYPDSETKLNGKNSGEYIAKVKDNYLGLQMWWDTRIAVK